MNNLTTFNFINNDVRTTILDGEPWFVLADVCAIFGIKDHNEVAERLEDYQRGGGIIPTPGGDQQMIVVNESGIYEVVMTSRKPVAKAFKKWVFTEVLPSIRKTGAYSLTRRYQAQNLNLEQVITDAMPEGPYKPFSIRSAQWGSDLASLRSFVAGGNLWFIMADIKPGLGESAMRAKVSEGQALVAAHDKWPVLADMFPADEATYICDATGAYEIIKSIYGVIEAQNFAGSLDAHNRKLLNEADIDPAIMALAPTKDWNRVEIRLKSDGTIRSIFADPDVDLKVLSPSGKYYDRTSDINQVSWEKTDVKIYDYKAVNDKMLNIA